MGKRGAPMQRHLKQGHMTACGYHLTRRTISVDSVAKTNCKRCLKALGVERRQGETAAAVDWDR